MAQPSALDRAFVAKALFVFLLVVLGFLLWRLADVLLMGFGAVVVAVLLRSIADPIQAHTPLGNMPALLVSILGLLTVFVASGWLFGAVIADQVTALMGYLPRSTDELRALIERAPFGEAVLENSTGAGAAAAGAGEGAESPGGPGGSDVIEQLASQASGLAGRLGGYAMSAAGAVTTLVLVIFAGVYLAVRPAQNRDALLLLLPQSAKPAACEALNATGAALKRWLVGTLAAMVLIGVVTGLVTWAIGLPAPLALGLFAGLTEFVPVVGPIVAFVPALLLALQQDPAMVLWTALAYLAIQQVEGNLIQPLIQRRAAHLPPFLTLTGVIVFGVLFGLSGVVLSTPLMLALYVMITILYSRRALGHDVRAPGEAK